MLSRRTPIFPVLICISVAMSLAVELTPHNRTLGGDVLIFLESTSGQRLLDPYSLNVSYTSATQSYCTQLCLLEYNTHERCSSANFDQSSRRCYINDRHVVDDTHNIVIENTTKNWIWINCNFGPPSSPTISSSQWDGTEAVFSWKAGQDGGFRQNFNIAFKKTTDSNFTLWKANIDDLGTTFTSTETITGLDGQSSYIVRVTSINSRQVGLNVAYVDQLFPTIEVTAEGYGLNDWVTYNYEPVMKINGQTKRSCKQRSYTFIVLDSASGEELYFKQYDVHLTPDKDQAAYNFYQSLPDGVIVVVCTFDEPKNNANKVLDIVKDLGANQKPTMEDRSALAMVGYKGADKPSWVTWKKVVPGGGVARVTAYIPLPP